jgi:hypothetical protein
MAAIEVQVCYDDLKQVYSQHEPATAEDRDVLMSWPGGGQEHVGFALLSEATKREAMFSMLINMSNKPGFVEKLQGMTDEERDATFEEMSIVVMHTMGDIVRRIAKDCVEAAFQDVSSK